MKKAILLFSTLFILFSIYLLVSKSVTTQSEKYDDFSSPRVLPTGGLEIENNDGSAPIELPDSEANDANQNERPIQTAPLSFDERILKALPDGWQKHDDGFARYYDTFISSPYETITLGGQSSDYVEVITTGGKVILSTSSANSRLNDPAEFKESTNVCKLSSAINCEEIEVDGIFAFKAKHTSGVNQEKFNMYIESVYNSTIYTFRFTFADSFNTTESDLIINDFIEEFTFE